MIFISSDNMILISEKQILEEINAFINSWECLYQKEWDTITVEEWNQIDANMQMKLMFVYQIPNHLLDVLYPNARKTAQAILHELESLG